jgi:hypothetical protein
MHQILQKLITIDFADHASGIIIVGDVCGILSKKIANNLINGIIALFVQSIENTPENTVHIFLLITGNSEFDCISGIVRHGNDLLPNSRVIIAQIQAGVKTLKSKFFELLAQYNVQLGFQCVQNLGHYLLGISICKGSIVSTEFQRECHTLFTFSNSYAPIDIKQADTAEQLASRLFNNALNLCHSDRFIANDGKVTGYSGILGEGLIGGFR